MDRRKLIKNSLHKNEQSINQPLERINSISDKQSSHSSDVVTQEKSDSFHERKLSDVKSSTLKSLNVYLREKNNSSIKNRKRSFCESENDVSETDNLVITSKISKVKSSKSKQFDNHISENTSLVSSQRENIHLSRNCVSTTNKFLDTANPSMEKSIAQKPKIANSSSSEEISDDPDHSHNEYNVIKKKLNKTILDRNIGHIIRDINISYNSPSSRKMYHKSPIKTITKPYISKKKQDNPKEFQLFSGSEKHKINKEHFSEKQNFHVPSIFSNFLQKCSIVLSTNGIHTLSKFLYYIHVLFLFFN